MAYSFGKINLNSKKVNTELDKVDNPILLDKSNVRADYNSPIIILLDKNYDSYKLNVISKFLEKNGIKKYKFVYSITLDLNQEKVKKELDKVGLIKFYKTYRADIESFIGNGSNIITSGPALYAFLKEDDIYPNHVDQIIFGKPSFQFSKDLSNSNNYRVFPIESFDNLFPSYMGYGGRSVNFWKNGYPCDSYKTKLAEYQFKRALSSNNIPLNKIPVLNKIYITSKDEFDSLFYEPNKDKREYVAWDTETSSLDFVTGSLGCITLSFDGVTGYYIPWRLMDDDRKSKLNEIFKNNKQITANGKFDVKWLWKAGVPSAHIDEDVIILGHILDETRSNSLKALAFYYSEFGGYERPLDEYKEKVKVESYLEIPEDLLKEYAVMDAIVTYRVWVNILAHLRELDKKYPNEFYDNNMENYYYDRRIPAVNMYSKIEYEGLYINKKKLDDLRLEMKKYIRHEIIDKLTETFNKELEEKNKHRRTKFPFIINEPDQFSNEKKAFSLKAVSSDSYFNWSSMREVGNLLVNGLGWENLGMTESGEIQVSDFQLDRWKKNHPEAKQISLLKSLNTLVNGFVGDDEGTKGWPQYIRKHDDGSYRIHANYMAMFTDSGRTKCNSPNFQNIPTRGMFSDRIKGCICTPDDENYYIATADYASLQIRLCAEDCIVGNLSDALKVPGVDMHSHTAYLSFYKGKEIDVDELEVEQNGKIYHFLGGELVLTKRGEVFANDLKEDDEILEE